MNEEAVYYGVWPPQIVWRDALRLPVELMRLEMPQRDVDREGAADICREYAAAGVPFLGAEIPEGSSK